MHLLTSVLIAAIVVGKKQNKELQGMPMLHTGPLQVHHVLPGRIRFIIPSLKDHHEAMRPALDQLASLSGIKEVKHSRVTGSLVVRFEPTVIPPDLLFAAIARLLGLEEELDRPKQAFFSREFLRLAKNVNHVIYDESRGLVDLPSLVSVTLLILGGRKLFVDRWQSLPGGITLIWWAINLLSFRKVGGEG
ncbi:MAG: hypothetical protein CSB34_05870 [Desulfobulbus propionicus]|nr:MAG: hypothetical protein CSB34_05870 [Desulfobulbus propionicus]